MCCSPPYAHNAIWIKKPFPAWKPDWGAEWRGLRDVRSIFSAHCMWNAFPPASPAGACCRSWNKHWPWLQILELLNSLCYKWWHWCSFGCEILRITAKALESNFTISINFVLMSIWGRRMVSLLWKFLFNPWNPATLVGNFFKSNSTWTHDKIVH